jgi:glycosyltransferase involved in cell wall biosynthesis
MKITFLVPEIRISGGIKAVFEFANELHERGHNVSVVYSLLPMSSGIKRYNIRNLASRIKKAIVKFTQGNRVEWFDLRANLIRVPTFFERFIPDGDIIVATWWETAYYVYKYSLSKGRKFYLVQHYEIWGGPEELVNNSYRLGLRIIVNSTWLKDILQNKLCVEVEALILHSPDLNQFYPENKKKNSDKIRILMPYRKLQWKGIEDGLRAFEIVRKRFSNIQLVMYGPEWDKKLPNYVEFYQKPSNDKLREIYNSCDIFVFPSYCEGFGMPPMEAMACKCAVVTTNVGAIPDYTIPGETALVSPPRAPELLAENIIKLVEDDELRKQIAEAGYNHINKNFSWDKSTEALEETFKKVLREGNHSFNGRDRPRR